MEKNWKDFVSLYGGIEGARANFEKVCYSLLKNQYDSDNVQLIEASPGDEGIDIYIGKRGTESIKVFQCKFFLEKISDSLGFLNNMQIPINSTKLAS